MTGAVQHILLCPPRSGSNFLQAMLETLTDMPQDTFYLGVIEQPERALVKSHAPSYAHLLDEMAQFGVRRILPSRFVIMWRHPVFSTLSAHAYHCYRKKTRIDLRSYLGLERPLPGYGSRPLSYEEHCRKFAVNWSMEEDSIHHVRYEELMLNPDRVLRNLCAFLRQQCRDGAAEMLSSISARLQIRWQGRSIQEPAYPPLPLWMRQYPAEFPDPDTRSEDIDLIEARLGDVRALLKYDPVEVTA